MPSLLPGLQSQASRSSIAWKSKNTRTRSRSSLRELLPFMSRLRSSTKLAHPPRHIEFRRSTQTRMVSGFLVSTSVLEPSRFAFVLLETLEAASVSTRLEGPRCKSTSTRRHPSTLSSLDATIASASVLHILYLVHLRSTSHTTSTADGMLSRKRPTSAVLRRSLAISSSLASRTRPASAVLR